MLPAVADSGGEQSDLGTAELAALATRHVRFGWSSIFVFVLFGMLLETLHGFKVGLYLDVSNEARRLVWTLAHTHGTLIGVLNLGFALTLPHLGSSASLLRLASRLFILAGIVMPLGFLLGGIVIYGGDPGLAIVLAPVGGVLLIGAVGLAALAALRTRDGGGG